MCKNKEKYGTCKYGDRCDFAHKPEELVRNTFERLEF